MAGQSATGWYPDPLGRFQHRYWDGGEWKEHVANAGVGAIDPLATSAAAVTGATAATDAHTAPTSTTWFGTATATASAASRDDCSASAVAVGELT